jgi:hypothetical protein
MERKIATATVPSAVVISAGVRPPVTVAVHPSIKIFTILWFFPFVL